jgi:hypothetical protein
MDEATEALAEAIFRAQFSDPYSESVDRLWTKLQPVVGYKETMIRARLRDQGYDIVRWDK